MDDSVITPDEIVEPYIKETNFDQKKATFKTNNFCILFACFIITITLLIVVSIYCYLIKYRAKLKHLLQFHNK